jgi:methyltransferase (TIGR00027 family)
VKPGRASSTAKVIAASTLLAASDPHRGALADAAALPLCRAFLSVAAADRWLRAAAELPALRPIWRALERWTYPGIVAHYGARKRAIEARTRAAIESGTTCVVIIGAGFDTLALRLAALYPKVRWVEVDHPDTQAAKSAGMAHVGVAWPGNVQTVPLDVSGGDLSQLAVTRNDDHVLLIMEGLLMYLPEEAAMALLTQPLGQSAAASVRQIFTYMARWPEGRAGFRPSSWLIDAWLRWRGEPFRWYATPGALRLALQSQGLRVVEHLEPPFDDVLKSHQQGKIALRGENLVVTELF